MNRLRISNPRRLIFFAVMLLLISAAMLLWMRDIVREVFVLPLSYLFFLISVFVRTTPQLYFWIVMLLLTFVIAYRSLGRRSKRTETITPHYMAELSYDPARRGRVYSWLNKYVSMLSSENGYYGNSFHQSLGRLVLETLAHRHHMPPLQVEQRLRSESLPGVPPDIREYVLRSLRPPEPPRTSLLKDLWKALTLAVRQFLSGRLPNENPAGGHGPDKRVDLQLARIIKYIEEELEVSYGDSGR
jgi:hypothetical protein